LQLSTTTSPHTYARFNATAVIDSVVIKPGVSEIIDGIELWNVSIASYSLNDCVSVDVNTNGPASQGGVRNLKVMNCELSGKGNNN
jgi:hypothetical protein